MSWFQGSCSEVAAHLRHAALYPSKLAFETLGHLLHADSTSSRLRLNIVERLRHTASYTSGPGWPLQVLVVLLLLVGTFLLGFGWARFKRSWGPQVSVGVEVRGIRDWEWQAEQLSKPQCAALWEQLRHNTAVSPSPSPSSFPFSPPSSSPSHSPTVPPAAIQDSQTTHITDLTQAPAQPSSAFPASSPALQSKDEGTTFRRKVLGRLTFDHDGGKARGYERTGDRCWSRYERGCFSEPSSHPRPSQALKRKLRKYVETLKGCPQTPRQALKALAAGRRTACRYILWSPFHGGIGNNILSLVATFVYALVSNRILLVDPNNATIAGLFCDPFVGVPSWILPHVHVLGGEVLSVYDYTVRLNKPFDLNQPPPAVLHFYIHQRIDMGPFFCQHFHAWASGASALVTSSNMFWVPALYYVPTFARHLHHLFPQRRIFATLAPLLLHPSNRVWDRVTRFLTAHSLLPGFAEEGERESPDGAHSLLPEYAEEGENGEAGAEDGDSEASSGARGESSGTRDGAPGETLRPGVHARTEHTPTLAGTRERAPGSLPCESRPRVGVQFRSGFGIYVKEGLAGMGHCLLQLHNERLQSPLCLPEQGVAPSVRPMSTVVASLDPNFRANVTSSLRQLGVPADVVEMTRERSQVLGSVAHNQQALFEILVLALSSDALLITPRSTFGYVTIGLSGIGKKAFFFNTDGSCSSATHEPCFLTPPENVTCVVKKEGSEEEGNAAPVELHLRGVGTELPGFMDSGVLVGPCPDAEWLRSHHRLHLGDAVGLVVRSS